MFGRHRILQRPGIQQGHYLETISHLVAIKNKTENNKAETEAATPKKKKDHAEFRHNSGWESKVQFVLLLHGSGEPDFTMVLFTSLQLPLCVCVCWWELSYWLLKRFLSLKCTMCTKLKTFGHNKHAWFDCNAKMGKITVQIEFYDHRTPNNSYHGSAQQLHSDYFIPTLENLSVNLKLLSVQN